MSTYCAHCGAAVQDNDVFCPQCGGRLRELGNTELVPEVATALPDAAVPPPREALPSVTVEPLSPDLAQLTEVAQDGSLVCPPADAPRKDRALRWIIVGLAAAALICCGCLVSLFLLTISGGSGSMSLNDFLRQLGLG